MTSRPPLPVLAAGGLAALLAAAGCTASPGVVASSTSGASEASEASGTSGASEASEASGTSGATGATEQPTATDGPRPSRTDVVLSSVTWDDAVGAVEAGGYVSPVVESGGTCTLRLEQDGKTVVVTAAALPDATTTVCGGLRTEPGALTGGRWSAYLEYASAATEGTSAPLPVEVPG